MSASQKLIDKVFQEYKAKPILPLELSEIQNLFKNPDISVEQFKLQYQQDPIFCATLLALAWQATKDKDSHPFAADHAMSIIGITSAKRYFAKLDIKNSTLLSDEVKFFLTSSLLAAELAKMLSNKPQLYWAAMLHQLPDIFLWHSQPKAMWRILYHKIKKPMKLGLFEEAKLGFNLFDWRIAVAKQSQMSELNLITYQKPRTNNAKELLSYIKNGISEKTPILKQWHHSDSWTILLSNWLAKSLLLPTMANSCFHYRAMMQQAFSLNNRKMTHIIAESLTITSHHLKKSKLFVPGINALYLRSKPLYPEWLITPEINLNSGLVFNKFQENNGRKIIANSFKSATTKKSDSSEQTMASPLIKDSINKVSNQNNITQNAINNTLNKNNSILINQLLEKPESFENSVKMIGLTLSSIIEHLNYDRVTLLSVEYNGEFASSKIALAKKGHNKIRPDFSFKKNAAQVATPLRKFIVQQGGLLFSKIKHEKIWPKLPLAIQKEAIESFFFFSIKPASQVKVLIYVDAEDLELFSGDSFVRLKLLLNALNSALKIREQNKK